MLGFVCAETHHNDNQLNFGTLNNSCLHGFAVERAQGKANVLAKTFLP